MEQEDTASDEHDAMQHAMYYETCNTHAYVPCNKPVRQSWRHVVSYNANAGCTLIARRLTCA